MKSERGEGEREREGRKMGRREGEKEVDGISIVLQRL